MNSKEEIQKKIEALETAMGTADFWVDKKRLKLVCENSKI
jgi:hypothetical protein